MKARVSPNDTFGVSLRLSAKSAETWPATDEREELKEFLHHNDMYLYTVNAFPYGPFKNRVVKKDVYEPDWSTDARATYTMQVADILAEVALPGVHPSIQSPPLGFKPKVTGPEYVNAFTRHVIGTVAHMIQLEKRTGRTVTLALEPEPACFLETTEEAVDYFKNHLYASRGRANDRDPNRLEQVAGRSRAAQAPRHGLRHLPPSGRVRGHRRSLQKLADNGIPVFKLQEAAALRVPNVTKRRMPRCARSRRRCTSRRRSRRSTAS